MTTIIRTKKDKNNTYTPINNKALRDTKLSAKARGIFAYLMSMPDDWKVYMKELIKHFPDGRDSIYSGMKELEERGYVQKDQPRNEHGRFENCTYTVYESPRAGKPDPGKPDPDEPYPENPPLLSTDNNEVPTERSTDPKVPKGTLPESSKTIQDGFDLCGSNIGDVQLDRNPIVSEKIRGYIVEMIDWGGFSQHRFPRPGEKPSKTLLKIAQCIKDIKAGEFCQKRRWKEDWWKAGGLGSLDTRARAGLPWEKVRGLLKRSCTRYGRVRESGDPRYIKTSLADFFYNPDSGTSQFLWYCFNLPEQGDASIARTMKGRLEKNHADKLEGVYNTNKKAGWRDFHEKMWWAACASLYTWYQKNHKDLTFFNRVFHDNRFNFRCGEFGGLIDRISDFYQANGGMWRKTFINPEKDTEDWDAFCAWMREEHNVELVISKGDVIKAEKMQAERDRERREKEIEAEMEMVGGDREKAEAEVTRRQAVEDLIPKHYKAVVSELKERGKRLPERMVRDMAQDRAEAELGIE